MHDIIIVGADIEIIELIESLNQFRIIGIIEKNLKKNKYYDYKILGNDENAIDIMRETGTKNIIITLDNPNQREKLYISYFKLGCRFPKIISKTAQISNYSNLSEGVIIQDNVVISSNVTIGKLVKVNINSTIMHDVIINNFVTVAPNVTTLGYVKIGKNSFIGASCTILPHLAIGQNVIIGAGSIVTKNIRKNSVYVGNPAKRLKDNI